MLALGEPSVMHVMTDEGNHTQHTSRKIFAGVQKQLEATPAQWY